MLILLKATEVKDKWNPKTVEFRESRDSDTNPKSKPTILALDGTGSMGSIAHHMIQKGLATTMSEIFARFTTFDPAVLTAVLGDVHNRDEAPLQVGQFESDLEIAQQLTEFFIEGGGGSNPFESYSLPWWFAGNKTSIDCFEKRGEKGFLFTIGDEEPTEPLTAAHLSEVFGPGQYADLTTSKEALEMARKYYHVFHVVVAEGSYCKSEGVRNVVKAWQNLMGQSVLQLDNYKKLAEVIVSTMEVVENNKTAEEVAATWDGDTSVVVRSALDGLNTAVGKHINGKDDKVVLFD